MTPHTGSTGHCRRHEEDTRRPVGRCGGLWARKLPSDLREGLREPAGASGRAAGRSPCAPAPAQAGGAERRKEQRCRQRLPETKCLETDAREPAEFAPRKLQDAGASSGSEGPERAAVFPGHSARPGVWPSTPNPGKLPHRCGRTESKTHVGSKAFLKKRAKPWGLAQSHREQRPRGR